MRSEGAHWLLATDAALSCQRVDGTAAVAECETTVAFGLL